MQFSRNNPTPPTTPKDAEDREDQPHTHPQRAGRVQPHNPIACLHLKPTTTHTFHEPQRSSTSVHRQSAKRPFIDVPPMSNPHRHTRTIKRPPLLVMLLRKEVIQPHLPVRLPCYDLVPITDPTFDSSLTRMGHWLRVLPTFVT